MTKPPATFPASPDALTGASPGVDVVPVRSRRDRLAFVRLPWEIYARDPHWVPPLLVERLDFIHPRKHPFYRHGAALQMLALKDGRPAGRIQVSDDPRFNAKHGANAGCFGLFESIDDAEVATALLDAAAAWLASRGRGTMLGPIDYSMNYACGLLVEGFNAPPRIMMNHNPPYYAELLQGWGMAKCRDLYSWWFDDPHDMAARWGGRIGRIVHRSRITVRPLDPRDMQAEIRRCAAVYNQSIEGQWGMVGMTDAELLAYGKLMARFTPPELALLAENQDQPVGLSITMPDVNEAIRPLNGRLTRWGLPLGYLRLVRGLQRVKTGRLLMLGVAEGYRRRGILERLIVQTLQNGKKLGIETAELGWTLEDNATINRAIEIVGGRHYKTYRIFQAAL